MSIETKKRGHDQQAAGINLPETMHAAAIDAFGGPKCWRCGNCQCPRSTKVKCGSHSIRQVWVAGTQICEAVGIRTDFLISR
ncbi:MAG TPA: hypothetical protein VHZ55_15730 [Bryobacteraceae bacterium]|jgi:hypothetical protein|nr:hypothetical protein [Bryobacteraceae bacterium]